MLLSSTVTLVATALARWLRGGSASSISVASSTASSITPSVSSTVLLPEFTIGPLRITQPDIIQALERLSEEYNPSSFVGDAGGGGRSQQRNDPSYPPSSSSSAKFVPSSRSVSVGKLVRSSITNGSHESSRIAIRGYCATVFAYELIYDALRNLREEYHSLCQRIQKSVTPKQDNHLQKLGKHIQRQKDTLIAQLIAKHNLPSNDIQRTRQQLLDNWSNHRFRMELDNDHRSSSSNLDTSILSSGSGGIFTNPATDSTTMEDDSLYRSVPSGSSSSASVSVTLQNISSLFPFPLPSDPSTALNTSLDTAIHLLTKENDDTSQTMESFFATLLPSSSSSASTAISSSSSSSSTAPSLYPTSIHLRLFANAAAKQVHSARNEVRNAALRVLSEVKQQYEDTVTRAITQARETAIVSTNRTWEDKWEKDTETIRTTEQEKYRQQIQAYQQTMDTERQRERNETMQQMKKVQEQTQRQLQEHRTLTQTETATKINDAVYQAKQTWTNEHQQYIDHLEMQHRLEIETLSQTIRETTIQELSQRAAEAHAKALAQAHQEYLQQTALQLDEIYAKHQDEIQKLQEARDQLTLQLQQVIDNCETAVQQRITSTLTDEKTQWETSMRETLATLQREYEEQTLAAVQNAKITATSETEARVKMNMTSVVTRSRMEGRLEGEQKTEERLQQQMRKNQEEFDRIRSLNEEEILRLKQELDNQRTEILRIQHEDTARRERLEAEVKVAASEVIEEADKRAQEKLSFLHQQELHEVCARLTASLTESFVTEKTEWEHRYAKIDEELRQALNRIRTVDQEREEETVTHRTTVTALQIQITRTQEALTEVTERYTHLATEHDQIMVTVQEATKSLETLTNERNDWLKEKEFYESEKRVTATELQEKTTLIETLSRTHQETLTKEREDTLVRIQTMEETFAEKIHTIERNAVQHEEEVLHRQAEEKQSIHTVEIQRYKDEVNQVKENLVTMEYRVHETETAYQILQQQYNELQLQHRSHVTTNDEGETIETNLRQEIERLRTLCADQQSTVTDYENSLQHYRDQLVLLQQEKETYEKERTENTIVVQGLETGLAEAIRENQTLTVTRDEALRHVQEGTVHLQGSERRVAEALAQQHRLQQLVDDYEKKMNDYYEQYVTMETTIQNGIQTIQELKDTVQELREKEQALRTERDNISVKYEDSLRMLGTVEELRLNIADQYRTLQDTYQKEIEKRTVIETDGVNPSPPHSTMDDKGTQCTVDSLNETTQTVHTVHPTADYVTVGTVTETVSLSCSSTGQQTEPVTEENIMASSVGVPTVAITVLEALQTEYDNYKVTHTVLLRKEEQIRHDIEEQLRAVIANRRLHEKTAEQSIDTLTKQITVWKNKYDTLQSDLQEVYQELEEHKNAQEEIRRTAEEWRTDALQLTTERDTLRTKLRTTEESWTRSKTEQENIREALYRSKTEYEQVVTSFQSHQEQYKVLQQRYDELQTMGKNQETDFQRQLDQAITTTAHEHDTAWETAVRQITQELETVAEQLTSVSTNPTEFTKLLAQLLREPENEEATGLSILIKTAMDSITSAVCSHYTLQVNQMVERMDQTVKETANQAQIRTQKEWEEKLRHTERKYDEEIRTLTVAYEERLETKDKLVAEYHDKEIKQNTGIQTTVESLTKQIQQLQQALTESTGKEKSLTVQYETTIQQLRDENERLRTQLRSLDTSRTGNGNKGNEETPRVLRKVLETNQSSGTGIVGSSIMDVAKDQFWLSPEPQELMELSRTSSTHPSTANYPNFSRRRDSLLRQSMELSPDKENNPRYNGPVLPSSGTPYRSNPSSASVSPDYLDQSYSTSSPLGLNLLATPNETTNSLHSSASKVQELQTAITDRDQLLSSAQEEIGILYDRLAEAVITITALQQELSSQAIIMQTFEQSQPSLSTKTVKNASVVTKIPSEVLDESLQSINMARTRLGRSTTTGASTDLLSVSKLDTSTTSAQDVTLQQCTVLLTSLSQTVERVFNEADALVPHGSGAPSVLFKSTVNDRSIEHKQSDDHDNSNDDTALFHESFLDTLNTSISELDANQAEYLDKQLEFIQKGSSKSTTMNKNHGTNNDPSTMVSMMMMSRFDDTNGSSTVNPHASMIQLSHTTRSLALGLIRMRTKASKLSSMLRHLRGGIAARLAAKDAVIDGLQRERLTYEMMLAQMRRTSSTLVGK